MDKQDKIILIVFTIILVIAGLNIDKFMVI